MLLGIWRNIKEMEDELSLPEIEAIVSAAREKEMRHHRFLAALKGIDLDENEGPSRFDEVKQRVTAKQSGKSVESLELEDMGMEIETEED